MVRHAVCCCYGPDQDGLKSDLWSDMQCAVAASGNFWFQHLLVCICFHTETFDLLQTSGVQKKESSVLFTISALCKTLVLPCLYWPLKALCILLVCVCVCVRVFSLISACLTSFHFVERRAYTLWDASRSITLSETPSPLFQWILFMCLTFFKYIWIGYI